MPKLICHGNECLQKDWPKGKNYIICATKPHRKTHECNPSGQSNATEKQ